jgi:phosphopantetheinyl transferase
MVRVQPISEILHEWSAHIEKILSYTDLQKAKKFVRQIDTDRYIAARLLCYQELLKKGPLSIPLNFVQSAHGKPGLPGVAEFSWSHSGDYVAFLCAPGAGVDIEQFSNVDPPSFTSVFSKDEIEWIGTDLIRFFKLWTIKESVMKSTGLGFQLNPLELSPTYDLTDERTWEMLWNRHKVYGKTIVFMGNDGKRYALSYCSTSPIGPEAESPEFK